MAARLGVPNLRALLTQLGVPPSNFVICTSPVTLYLFSVTPGSSSPTIYHHWGLYVHAETHSVELVALSLE